MLKREPFNSLAYRELKDRKDVNSDSLVALIRERKNSDALLPLLLLRRFDERTYAQLPVDLRANVLTDALQQSKTSIPGDCRTFIWRKHQRRYWNLVRAPFRPSNECFRKHARPRLSEVRKEWKFTLVFRLLKKERSEQFVQFGNIDIRMVASETVAFISAARFVGLMQRCDIGTGQPLTIRFKIPVGEPGFNR